MYAEYLFTWTAEILLDITWWILSQYYDQEARTRKEGNVYLMTQSIHVYLQLYSVRQLVFDWLIGALHRISNNADICSDRQLVKEYSLPPLHAPSIGLCYTSCGSLARMRNKLLGEGGGGGQSCTSFTN